MTHVYCVPLGYYKEVYDWLTSDPNGRCSTVPNFTWNALFIDDCTIAK